MSDARWTHHKECIIWLIDWLIDWIGFHATSAIYQSCNDEHAQFIFPTNFLFTVMKANDDIKRIISTRELRKIPFSNAGQYCIAQCVICLFLCCALGLLDTRVFEYNSVSIHVFYWMPTKIGNNKKYKRCDVMNFVFTSQPVRWS